MFEDLKHSLRVLLKNPGFTAIAVIVLALGIGANTAIFSVVNAALLRPLPFADPSRLVQLWHVPPPKSFPGMTRFAVSAGNYSSWAQQNNVFASTALYGFSSFDFIAGDKPESVPAGIIEPTFFSVYGVHPILGRTFLPEEDQPGRSQVVVLSYDFWRSHFGSDNVIGHTVNLNGAKYTVVGVMGPNFRRPDWAKIWTPIALTNAERAVRGEHHFLAVARLRPGVTLRQAQSDMDLISRRLEKQFPEDDKGWGAVVVPLRQEMVGDVRPALLILLGAVALVLLIACANISNLILARALVRRKEMAIRTAIGASRGRIVRHVLAEAVTLSIFGGAIGLLLAWPAVKFLSVLLTDKLPHDIEIHLDGWVLLFTVAISIVAGMLSGLLPAFRFSAVNIESALRQGLGKTDSDSGGQRSLKALATAEVALSLMLLIGAGLMIQSLIKLTAVNAGIDPRNVLTMTISVSRQKFATPAQENAFFHETLQRVRALPGIESAGVIDSLPVSGNGSMQPVAIPGRTPAAMADQPEVAVRVISPEYIQAMHIPLLHGRDFSESDTAQSQNIVLISQSLAKRFWPGEDPIARKLTLTFFPQSMREIAGVVGDVNQDGLDMTQPAPTIYMPLSQLTPPALGSWSSFPFSLVVRTSGPIESTNEEITHAIHKVDPTAPVLDIKTMDDLMSNSLSQRRLNMELLASFAGLALVLAATGIYGVLSYSVRRRVKEIGVRMALGARLNQVLGMVILEGMKMTVFGLVIGVVAALMFGRVLSGLVFGVSTTDALTYVTVSALLVFIALLASIVPAYRAARLDPIRTLRDE